MFAALAQENLLASLDTLDTDNEVLATENLFVATTETGIAFETIDELDSISSTIDDLDHLSDVVTQHGVTESLLAFTNRNQLLTSTFPAFGAVEALHADAGPNSAEALAVLEALKGSTESLVGSWFKSAWDAATSVVSAIGNFAKAAAQKVGSALSWFGNKVYNAAKATKDFIVAHPIASVFLALTAIAAAGTVGSMIWGGALPETTAAIAAWKNGILSKINTALGKYGFKAAAEAPAAPVTPAAKTLWQKVTGKTADALGYTKEKSIQLKDAIKNAYNATPGGQSAIGKLDLTIKTRAEKLLDGLKSAPSATVTAGRQAITWLLKQTRAIWAFISGHLSPIIFSALTTLRNVFAPKDAAAPPAAAPAAA